MSALHLTRHAILRMSQCGIRLDDVELVEAFGTEVEGGHLVRQKDAQVFERDERWPALSGQVFALDKWTLCRLTSWCAVFGVARREGVARPE